MILFSKNTFFRIGVWSVFLKIFNFEPCQLPRAMYTLQILTRFIIKIPRQQARENDGKCDLTRNSKLQSCAPRASPVGVPVRWRDTLVWLYSKHWVGYLLCAMCEKMIRLICKWWSVKGAVVKLYKIEVSCFLVIFWIILLIIARFPRAFLDVCCCQQESSACFPSSATSFYLSCFDVHNVCKSLSCILLSNFA